MVTEVIVGEPISIELEFPEIQLASGPTLSEAPQRADYYSAVILGPPSSTKGHIVSPETSQKARDEDFQETIEFSWTEPAEASAEEQAEEKEHSEADRWRGQYT